MKFRVHLTNFGYDLDGTFTTFEEAETAARKAGFQCGIWYGDELAGTYCPLFGIRRRTLEIGERELEGYTRAAKNVNYDILDYDHSMDH